MNPRINFIKGCLKKPISKQAFQCWKDLIEERRFPEILCSGCSLKNKYCSTFQHCIDMELSNRDIVNHLKYSGMN